MAQGPSSLPPLKTNKGKYGIVLLVFLFTCGAVWLYLRGGHESDPQAEAVEEAPPPPKREQFAPEIEIPEQDAGTEEEEAQEPKAEAERRPREPVECTGTLKAAQIRTVINGPPRKQVQTCYEQRLKENNLLQGQMTVLLTIGSSGAVRNVQVSGSLRDAEVYSCVRRVARSWKFPRPEGGCVRTAVPFTMMPKL